MFRREAERRIFSPVFHSALVFFTTVLNLIIFLRICRCLAIRETKKWLMTATTFGAETVQNCFVCVNNLIIMTCFSKYNLDPANQEVVRWERFFRFVGYEVSLKKRGCSCWHLGGIVFFSFTRKLYHCNWQNSSLTNRGRRVKLWVKWVATDIKIDHGVYLFFSSKIKPLYITMF